MCGGVLEISQIPYYLEIELEKTLYIETTFTLPTLGVWRCMNVLVQTLILVDSNLILVERPLTNPKIICLSILTAIKLILSVIC